MFGTEGTARTSLGGGGNISGLGNSKRHVMLEEGKGRGEVIQGGHRGHRGPC